MWDATKKSEYVAILDTNALNQSGKLGFHKFDDASTRGTRAIFPPPASECRDVKTQFSDSRYKLSQNGLVSLDQASLL